MNILIIEDSSSVSHIISSILRSREYIVKESTSNQFEERDIKSGVFELAIINTSLDRSTQELLKRIRTISKKMLLLGVSTKSTWKEKVEFLNCGGDDVLDYPFPMQELLARISSLQRRPKESNEGMLKFKDLEINSEAKNVTKSKKEIPLRRREFTLLEYMVRNKNRTVSRAELLDHVWDYRRATGSNTVDVHVKRLRDKLMDRDLIETVHGFGYTIKDKKVEPNTELQDL
jgi:DNA-binding response OmpR family regulator